MVIFHSYVSSPDGNREWKKVQNIKYWEDLRGAKDSIFSHKLK
jgi:hypothetical protein